MPEQVPISSGAAGAVSDFLARLSLAPRQAHKALTLWPLLRTGAAPPAPPYVTLSQALASGAFGVEELREGAQVPRVLVENRGDVAVLVLFGEEIRGALQNRIANASFLIPPHRQMDIDVSCVEGGRWSSRGSSAFAGTGEIMAGAIRAKMAGKVSGSRKRGLRFVADQGEVWAEVDQRLDSSRIGSATRAYADYLAARRSELESAAAAFHPVPGQVGFVAAIGSDVVGLEAIGRPEVFATAFAGLVRAYVVDAIDAAGASTRAEPAPAARFDAPEPFLAALAATPAEDGPSLGLGRDLRIEGERACGCALAAGDVVHLTAFPAPGGA